MEERVLVKLENDVEPAGNLNADAQATNLQEAERQVRQSLGALRATRVGLACRPRLAGYGRRVGPAYRVGEVSDARDNWQRATHG